MYVDIDIDMQLGLIPSIHE